VAAVVGAVLLVAVVLIVVLAGGSDDGDEAGTGDASGEVFLEPVSSTIDNPFAPSVGTDLADVTPPPALAASNRQEFTGGTVGLYGGTLDNSSCDKDKLVSFLGQDAAKADVWARTLGIPTGIESIRDYVATLTSVVLRADTRVTNHGYAGGRATTIDAVLQAGTAVLVDKYGTPVVKCYCGNPLTAPKPYRTPVYTGTRWPTFTPTSVTVIVKNTVVINTFTLVDPRTGQAFDRPAGGNGSTDRPATTTPSSGSSTSTTTTRPRGGGADIDGTYQITFPAQCGFTEPISATLTARRTGSSLSLTLTGDADPVPVTVTMTSAYEFSGSGTEDGQPYTITGRFEPSGGGGMQISATITEPDCTADFSGTRTG
jgi:hypothetical protein